MRKLVGILVLVVISFIGTAAVAPHAEAFPQYGTETYYYNYGSQGPDGTDAQLCGNYWSEGDTTPDNGGLKQVITWKCDDGTYTVAWYRFHDPGCVPTWWELIQEPVYWRVWYC